MEGTRLNQLNALIFALVASIIPVLNLAGVTHLTSDGIALVMLVVTNVLNLVGFVFAQQKSTNV